MMEGLLSQRSHGSWKEYLRRHGDSEHDSTGLELECKTEKNDFSEVDFVGRWESPGLSKEGQLCLRRGCEHEVGEEVDLSYRY